MALSQVQRPEKQSLRHTTYVTMLHQSLKHTTFVMLQQEGKEVGPAGTDNSSTSTSQLPFICFLFFCFCCCLYIYSHFATIPKTTFEQPHSNTSTTGFLGGFCLFFMNFICKDLCIHMSHLFLNAKNRQWEMSSLEGFWLVHFFSRILLFGKIYIYRESTDSCMGQQQIAALEIVILRMLGQF